MHADALGDLNMEDPFQRKITASATGHVSLALENEVAGIWGQDVHFLHVKRYDFVFGCSNRAVPQ